MSVFSEALANTGLPPEALKPIEDKLTEAFDLIVENNNRVAQVNAAKAQDPNDTEYLDERWKSNAQTDPEITEEAEKFYAIAEEYEKLLKSLREKGKKHIPEALSEEKTKEVRALVNASAGAIAEAKTAAATMATVVDSVLSMHNKAIEGGIISLLPPVESLKNTRGRKASNAAGAGSVYMTRVGDIHLDGKSTNREIGGEMKGKFNFAADDLSTAFGADKHPDNQVTAEELEEAYYAAIGKPVRSLKSSELPAEITFTFTKNVKTQNANDDSFTEVPKSIQVKVFRPEAPAKKVPVAEVKSETPKTDTPTETPKATETPAPVKSTETKSAPAKATSPQAKK